MLTADQINNIHRLDAEHWSLRRIARHLQMDTRTVKKYLLAPAQKAAPRPRASKLDAFRDVIDELLQQDPRASAAVICQRLKPLGFIGGRTILQEYVRGHRPVPSIPRAFVRMEPNAGERCEVDWGHFGALNYAGDKRKLYAFALVECHSRLLYLEFTHSQSFETFARCHIHAFHALGGCSREIWFDNLATAVAEHDGRLVCFHPRFLAFAKEYGFYPRACNRAAGWEKGKVERGGIGYVRQNFWPLRQFSDLHDVNRQAKQWLQEVANQRLHRETRQRPVDRFQPSALRSLPALTPDYRDSVEALVHKDIRLHFDGNRYGSVAKI
jgi:transposase